MVMAPPNRTNLLTVPNQQPRVSLWGSWQIVRRQVLLPLEILDPKAKLFILPPKKSDGTALARLRVVWPKTRNYAYVDEHELVVEVDTGRIVKAIQVTGTKGQNRAVYHIRSWAKAGALRLPARFDLKSVNVRGGSLAVSDLRVDVTTPKDVWSREKKLIATLVAKPSPEREAKKGKKKD